MSDTAQLFIMAGVWTVAAAILAFHYISKWPARIAAFALLFGVPFGELPYGYYNFRLLCASEARVQIFEPISPQSNVCVDYPFEHAANEVLKSGFARVEARGKSGDVREFVAVPTTDRPGGRANRITANYCISIAMNINEPWRILRHDLFVRRASDERVVARQSQFSWRGMWWQEAASPILGRGGHCYSARAELFNAVKQGEVARK
jgi:hypothetical protein